MKATTEGANEKKTCKRARQPLIASVFICIINRIILHFALQQMETRAHHNEDEVRADKL